VPPFSFSEVERILREDIGADVFARLDPEPLAAASIAQIHGALLADGREVVVKVRRPAIEEQVELDLDVIRSTVGFLEERSETARLLQLRALEEELEVHLRSELDLVEEAANTELIGRSVEDYEDLVVPQVIRPYVTERVLVLERINGTKVTADHGLSKEQAERLARDFFRAYIRQVTLDGIYHADPHGGNVILTEDGRLARLHRPDARSGPGSDPADRRGIVRARSGRGGAPARARALHRLPADPARRALAPAEAPGPDRRPARDGDADGGRGPDGAGGHGTHAPLGREPGRRRADRGRAAHRFGAHGARRPRGLAGRLLPLRRHRALHDLAPPANAGRALRRRLRCRCQEVGLCSTSV
jgi:hypothetical protein